MMKGEKPKDQLTEVDLTVSEDEEPQVYALQRNGSGWTLSRRDFLTAAAAAGVAIYGCSPEAKQQGVAQIQGNRQKAQQTVTERKKVKKDAKCDNVFAHTGSVRVLAIRPDSRFLASGSYDNTIKLWSLPEGNMLRTLEGHKGSVYALSISPNGRLLASGGLDETIKLWSLPEGGLIKTIKGHKDKVLALSIGPDGKRLVSGSSDKTIRLWSLPEGKLQTCLMDLKASPKEAEGIQYKARNELGQLVTYTLPCGSPIPPGAVCICNCVPGSWTAPAPPRQSSGKSGRRGIGSGGTICTCVPVHYWYPN